MILDKNKNTVCFSSKLASLKRFKPAYERIIAILDKHSINTKLIPGTKDIWCRDYMPVQLGRGNYVQFNYKPTYLKENPELITKNNHSIIENSHISKSNIILDGGNLVFNEKSVILSERVFKENKSLSPASIKNDLDSIFDREVYFFKEINSDFTGHADGYLRFSENGKIIVNHFENEYLYWQKSFLKMTREAKLDYIQCPYFEIIDQKHPLSAIGSYINFLKIANLIILPIFEVSGNLDKEAYDFFKIQFPNKTIETVNINEIANEGGLLNCCTWTIQQ